MATAMVVIHERMIPHDSLSLMDLLICTRAPRRAPGGGEGERGGPEEPETEEKPEEGGVPEDLEAELKELENDDDLR